jgi:hypothetical protein
MCVVAAALAGSAAGSNAKQQTGHLTAVRARAAPPGYQVVTSGFDAAGLKQSMGQVKCPAGTVVYGGGVEIVASTLNANVNSSYPLNRATWAAWVNNGSLSDTALTVYAICAKQTLTWSLRSVVYNDSSTGSTFGEATCPSTSRVLGGGVYSASASLGENVASSWPVVSGQGTAKRWRWRVRMTSQNLGGSTFRVYAVCGSTPGYTIVKGPAMNESLAEATCPSPRVPLSGGAQAGGSHELLLTMNTTVPALGTSWRTYENNAASTDRTATPYVVCAGR